MLKNIIVAIGGVAALALAYSAVSYVTAYGRSIQPSSFRSFSVSADAKTTSIPDVAEFSFQVITEGGVDLSSLQAKNTEAMNNAIDFVKGQGVAAKDIKTAYYNVNPRYENYSCYDAPVTSGEGVSSSSTPSSSGVVSGTAAAKPSGQTVRTCPPAKIVGYTVTQSVDVKMRDFKKISDIMGGVVTNGANQVGSLSFTIDDPTAVQDVARAEAIAKAKVKAESMAKAGGFRLGRLLGITEGSNNAYPMYKSYRMDAGLTAPSTAATPAIEPGSQDTSVTVTLQYEIR